VRSPESELLIRLFRAGLAAADPSNCLPPFLPTTRPAGRTVVLGAGKAAASMAAVLVAHHAAHQLGPVSGAVVTRYGHGLEAGEETPGIEILEAAHPVPDDASVVAGARILRLARSCEATDRCIVLLSGGASALLVQPVPGVTLADKQQITRSLLASGASIAEINAVRRRLSLLKGGGLARQIRAGEILLYAISDVPCDEIADIGSGPLSPDPGSLVQARAIVARYNIPVVPAVADALLERDDTGREAPGGQPATFPAVKGRIIASSATAVIAAARAAEAAGWPAQVLPEARGSAQDTAREHAAMIRGLRAGGQRRALISGGETTVSVTHPDGRGGRNGEYLLVLALALGSEGGVHALAADTDGIDGTGDNAGALLTPDTLRRAIAVGQDAIGQLGAQRSYAFFATLGDLVTTGPTRTNVNDLRIALIG
jgi:hydroxypyruvate reductase